VVQRATKLDRGGPRPKRRSSNVLLRVRNQRRIIWNGSPVTLNDVFFVADQSELSFVIYGNSKTKKKPGGSSGVAVTATASLATNGVSPPVTNSAQHDFGSDLRTAFFRAEPPRKYLAHHQPVAPPASLETDLDIIVPHSSHVASDDVSAARQLSIYSASSDYELHELDNVVNTLKNVV